ncbi:MAG TPA: helix-turn-helix domain-containing protein [Candidatus Acidoferrum sp.]|nr:helix-turn-helix domain-containing protein [Candidatus Acidoferrum sp.]
MKRLRNRAGANTRAREPGSRADEKGKVEIQPSWLDSEKRAQIETVCARLGIERRKPLKEALPPEITFDEIRLAVARLRLELEEQSSKDF